MYLENNTLKYQGENFYPVVMNYGVNYCTDGTNYWAVPSHGYGSTINIECSGASDCLETIKAGMQLLQDLGFNAIRLVGVRPKYINGNQLTFSAYTSNSVWHTNIDVPLQSDYSIHFELISEILDIVEEVGLRVILLNLGPFNDPIREAYMNSLLNEFKNNSTIFAYDFINEPLYEDDITSDKSDVRQIVSNWRDMMDSHAPNHLLTVGFANSSEINRWDPNILPIDFASFHPYGSSETVQNEIYYYGQYINKPWIIGETGLAADNTTVTYEERRDFAEKTLKRTVNCGGNGYSWWQYQEVWWGSYGQDYLGLLNHSGTTATTDPSLVVEGAPKPAAQEFTDFEPYTPTDDCECLSSFYNYSGHSDYIISGRLLNGTNSQPIAGGIVVGWDASWNNYRKTFTKPDGTFNFYADVPLVHIRASAPGMNQTSYTGNWSGTSISLTNGIVNIGEVKSYSTSSTISSSNYTVKGNGTSGGNLKLYAGRTITFGSGFSVEKGGVLTAEPKYEIGDLKVYPISSCYSSLKSANAIAEDNSFESNVLDDNEDFIISVYPNPSEGFVNIISNSKIDNLVIYNQNGQQIKKIDNDTDSYQLNLTEYPSGLYYMIVYSGNNIERNEFILK